MSILMLLAAICFLIGALRNISAAGNLAAKIDWLCFGLFFWALSGAGLAALR